MPELLLGAGSRKDKRIFTAGKETWEDLTTLDFNADHSPDVVHDLTSFPYPFEDSFFSEIHAYDVVEHLYRQGDFRAFFAFWSEVWRIATPGSFFIGTSPMRSSPWAWGDPGHTAIVSREALTFLDQTQYTSQVGKTPMTDYRFCYKADWKPVEYQQVGDNFVYILQAVKPVRIGQKVEPVFTIGGTDGQK